MLQARVLTLSVLTDDGKVNIVVPGLSSTDRFADDDAGINIKLLTHGDVPGDMARGLEGGEQDAYHCSSVIYSQEREGIVVTLEADFVALHALDGLFEETLASRGDTRDVILLPLNGGIDMLEDLLDRVCDFGANTISGNKCYGIYTAVLGR